MQNETRDVSVVFPTFDGDLNIGDTIKFFESPKHEIGQIVVTEIHANAERVSDVGTS